MTSYRKQKKGLMAEINVVPYIDVMLVLLIIFMITAPLLAQGIKIDLPQADSQPVNIDDPETLVVTVDRRGTYFLDDRKIALSELSTKVTKIMQIRPNTPVLVRGDRRVDYGKVVAVMSVLQQAGAPTVGLATEGLDLKKRNHQATTK